MKRSVLDYLENTAKRCPERLAWDASAPFTFGQWWDAAQRIASSLSSRCARNTPVAVLMNPRSAECVKVFFGVWAAGCFYAPLDPMLPPERLKLIMQNLQPTAKPCESGNCLPGWVRMRAVVGRGAVARGCG